MRTAVVQHEQHLPSLGRKVAVELTRNHSNLLAFRKPACNVCLTYMPTVY